MRSEASLKEALGHADLRVLLMSMFHLTGHERWLEAPFRPQRDVRLIADPGAGFDAGTRDEIVHSAFGMLWPQPLRSAVVVPDEELLIRMMGACLGEPVPPEYAPMMMQEMGFRPDRVPQLARADLSAIVIGAGISGIAAAMRLKQAGVRVLILEKNPDVGGTWYENTYPDCGVDTPNHFYSYSFAPNNGWTRHFSLQPEILRYLSHCTDRFGIRNDIEFGTTARTATWDDAAAAWHVRYLDAAGRELSATGDLLVSAVGQLNRPSSPAIDGLDRFLGVSFHSAHWNHDVDLGGRRIGVIGAGASAMQFVPQIAERCGSLTIFQRTPQWARPIPEYRAELGRHVPTLIEEVPYYRAWLRFAMAWRYGDGLHRHLFRDPSWPNPDRSVNEGNERHRAELEGYIRAQLAGRPDLVRKSLPAYPPYAKRMLIDNGWYRTLTRSNVSLMTDEIVRCHPDGLETADGARHPLDVLVLATGFQATRFLQGLDVTGRRGVRLHDLWTADDARAHLGISVPGFPNFFVMYGPNTNLAHGGSIIFHAECQVRYMLDLVEQTRAAGADAATVRQDVFDEYNRRVDAAHEHLVWTHPGVKPWYRNRAGRVVSNSPWRLVDYWHMTKRADLSEYELSSSRTSCTILTDQCTIEPEEDE